MRKTHTKDVWTRKGYERHLKSQGKKVPVKAHTVKRGGTATKRSQQKPRKLFGIF